MAEGGLLRWRWVQRGQDGAFERGLKRVRASARPLCEAEGLAEYVKRVARAADWLLLVDEPTAAAPDSERGRAVRGFALLKILGGDESGPTRVFLDVICAKGVGRAMLAEIRAHTVRLGLPMVELHALPNVIGFYRKQGYINAPPGSCTEDPEITRRAAEPMYANARFDRNDRAIRDKGYSRFLKLLVRHGTAANAKCKGIGQSGNPAARPGCSFDGYNMNLCLARAD
jgi:hypothetical protein